MRRPLPELCKNIFESSFQEEVGRGLRRKFNLHAEKLLQDCIQNRRSKVTYIKNRISIK